MRTVDDLLRDAPPLAGGRSAGAARPSRPLDARPARPRRASGVGASATSGPGAVAAPAAARPGAASASAPARPTTPVRRVLRALGALATVVAVVVAVAVVLLRAAQVQPVTVLTGSMAPRIEPGDVALVQRGPASGLRTGEIATFSDPSGKRRTLTHRVRALLPAPRPVDGKPGIVVVTRGDANDAGETWRIARNGTVGETRAVLPGVAGLRPLMVGRGRAMLTGGLTVLAVVLLLLAGRRALRAG